MTPPPNELSKLLDAGITKPCTICGKRCGGGVRYCPTCKLYYCFACGLKWIGEDPTAYPPKCPCCGQKLPSP